MPLELKKEKQGKMDSKIILCVPRETHCIASKSI